MGNKVYSVFTFFGLLALTACVNEQQKVSPANKQNFIRVNKDMKAEYYKDSSLYGLVTWPQGGVCAFYPNGMIWHVFSHINNKEVTDKVSFDDSGRIKVIMGYDNKEGNTTIFFGNTSEVTNVYPHLGVITESNPFVTLDPDKDTITLGETYRAKIILNFPAKGYNSEIYTSPKLYDTLQPYAKGPETIFIETPTDTGQHQYLIGILQTRYEEVNGRKKKYYQTPIYFTAKYYVRPKK